MAKYHDLKNGLDFIRKEYNGKEPFRFTLSDLANAVDISEKKAKDLIQKINNRAQFWRGRFVASDDNYVVSSQVFERIKDWCK